MIFFPVWNLGDKAYSGEDDGYSSKNTLRSFSLQQMAWAGTASKRGSQVPGVEWANLHLAAVAVVNVSHLEAPLPIIVWDNLLNLCSVAFESVLKTAIRSLALSDDIKSVFAENKIVERLTSGCNCQALVPSPIPVDPNLNPDQS